MPPRLSTLSVLATVSIAAACWGGWSPAAAQPKRTRIDLASIPDNIKKLDWRSIDTTQIPPLERVRATMLLDDTLRELGAQMTAEADLLSEYIEQQNLGAEFAAQPEINDPPAVTFPEALKVAAALLRGPMASSTYASALADAPADTLPASEKLYHASAERRWSTAAEARMYVRSMTRFLHDTKRMDAYKAWLPGEIESRAKEAEAEASRQKAELEQKQKEAADQREQRRQQIQEQKKAREEQEERERQASLQMQEAMCAAQQSLPPESTGGTIIDDDYPTWYYGGIGYLGPYPWYRDSGYQGRAADRVSNRMQGWRGGGGGGRVGGGGGRGGGRR